MRQQPMLMVLELSLGGGEMTVGLEHPLMAHFTAGAGGKWRYLVVDIPGRSGLQVIGTLMLTLGKRILFFPTYEILATANGESDLTPVEHITLDPRRDNGKRASHIAFVGSDAQRGVRGINHQVGSDGTTLDYWFSLRIPVDSRYHTDLPATLKSPFDVEEPGMQNRLEAKVGEMIRSTQLGVPIDDSTSTVRSLQLDFWTSPDNPHGISTSPMGFRSHHDESSDSSVRPAGQTDFDFGMNEVWFRVLVTVRGEETTQVQLFRSRINDGFAELLT